MAINGTKVIDLDSHLVGDVANWKHCIEDAWKEHLPRPLPTAPDERRKTLVGTRVMVQSELTRQSGEKPEWHKAEDLVAAGRVRNLDKDAIDVAVLSPNSPALDLVWFPDDPELAAVYCRAENNYMRQYAGEFPERLQWAGVVPWQDAELAVKELHRMADMGNQALNMKAVPVAGRQWWDPYYNPIYAELENLGWPIIIHDTKHGSMGQERFADNFFFSHMVGRVFESMVCMMTFICGGVLERFPKLNLVCLETGASQMPWWLGRMDEHFEKLPHLVPWLKMKPSEYFMRQVYVGCEPFEDEHFEVAVEMLGDDNLVLATDTPHWDSSPPGEVTRPIVESDKLTEENKRKILGENAARILN